MDKQPGFPRTTVGGVSLPRMLIGTNWLVGYSHTSPASDAMIRSKFDTHTAIGSVLEAFVGYGVDAVMGIMDTPHMPEAIALAEEKTGHGIIRIDTPILNVENTPEARRESEAIIRRCKALGSTFCMPHHSCVEKLIRKDSCTIERLTDYLSMIRQAGMVPGLSAHMPEVIVYSDQNGYDVETYIQIYNCAGFLMQVEIEYIHQVIHNAKKPVMTIKPMAAGRVSPFVGLTFSYSTIRPCDMVTVGCGDVREVHEDVEIGLAAIERRAPRLEGRDSPNKTEIMQA